MGIDTHTYRGKLFVSSLTSKGDTTMFKSTYGPAANATQAKEFYCTEMLNGMFKSDCGAIAGIGTDSAGSAISTGC